MKQFLLMTALLAACNPNDAGSNGVVAPRYAGPSPEWTAQINGDGTSMLLQFPSVGALMATQLINTSDISDSGGFTLLTVTSSAGTGAPAEGAAGVAIASTALYLLQPFADGAPIAMTSAGFCPTAAVTGHFVALTGSVRSGSFGYDPMTGVATSNALAALGGGACSEGVASLDSGAQLFLSQSGVSVLQLASGDTVLALPAGDVATAPADVAGHYAGIAYDGAKTRAVAASLESNDVAVTGVATALDGSIALELVLMGSGGSPGILTATLGGSAATCIASAGTLACASATASVVLVL